MGKGRRQGGRETSVCGCFSLAPCWGPRPQPRHVPWLGIELVTLWFTGWCSIHWPTPARADKFFLKCMLVWQLSQHSLTKLFRTKLKATKYYNGHHKEKTKWTFWPTQYLVSLGGFTAQVPAPDAGAQADVPQRYSGSELNDLLDLSMQCVGWGRGGFKSRCQVAKRSSWNGRKELPWTRWAWPRVGKLGSSGSPTSLALVCPLGPKLHSFSPLLFSPPENCFKWSIAAFYLPTEQALKQPFIEEVETCRGKLGCHLGHPWRF